MPSDGFVLKPGQCILARIDEDIQIPLDCLGKIEARSGINRLLLIVTLGDFVNPGYKGHYPLQIINMSKYKIKIYPKMSVCQLLLSELSSIPEKRFSESSSSYYFDNGGPACWWSDHQLKLFMKENADLEKKHLEQIKSICEDNNIIKYLPDILSRYKIFYKKSKLRNENLEKSLERFMEQERKAQDKTTLQIKILKALMVLIASLASIGTVISIIAGIQKTNNNFSLKGIIIWAAVFAAAVIVIYLFIVKKIHNLEQRIYLS